MTSLGYSILLAGEAQRWEEAGCWVHCQSGGA